MRAPDASRRTVPGGPAAHAVLERVLSRDASVSTIHRVPSDSASVTSLRVVRKVAVAAIGASVLTFGVVLVVLPGPSILVIPLGLAILATEFLWARQLLHRFRKLLQRRPKSI